MLRQVRHIGIAPPDSLQVTRFQGDRHLCLMPSARGEIKPCLRRVPSRPFCLCCSWSRDPVCSLSSLACGDVLCCLIQSATLRLSITQFSPLIPKFLMGSSESSLELCSQKHPDPELWWNSTTMEPAEALKVYIFVTRPWFDTSSTQPWPAGPWASQGKFLLCFSSHLLASTPMRFVPLP